MVLAVLRNNDHLAALGDDRADRPPPADAAVLSDNTLLAHVVDPPAGLADLADFVERGPVRGFVTAIAHCRTLRRRRVGWPSAAALVNSLVSAMVNGSSDGALPRRQRRQVELWRSTVTELKEACETLAGVNVATGGRRLSISLILLQRRALSAAHLLSFLLAPASLYTPRSITLLTGSTKLPGVVSDAYSALASDPRRRRQAFHHASATRLAHGVSGVKPHDSSPCSLTRTRSHLPNS